ncbi:hypothetical protein [Pectobacterium actinidiae]|uniref:hypothetical protein n=1 Tax=Pectobacterium actinidiae TaxID=1507808 RepID=UPI0037F812C7
MASNYYEATGVLVLDRVTPVINALFRGLNLNAAYPGDGQAYIAHNYNDSSADWDTICEELAAVAASLGLFLPDEQTPWIAQVLETLSLHFGVDQDEALRNLIEHHPFEDVVAVDALFLIATRFDDGHGLKEIRIEGSWSSSKLRLFEFGGDGCFLSREFETFSDSGLAWRLGSAVRGALLNGELNKAASAIAREADRLLAGISDDTQRATLYRLVAEQLGDGTAATRVS